MVGADTDRLREIAASFEARAQWVAAARETCLAEHEALVWRGPDAEAFRDRLTAVTGHMGDLADAVRRRADELVGQAKAQEAASAARSASGPRSAGPAVSGPGRRRAGGARATLLGAISDEQLAELASLDDPSAVAAFFADLGYDPHDPVWVEAMQALGAAKAELIGDLEGAPYVARDAANRSQLAMDIEILREQLGVTGSAAEEIARLQERHRESSDPFQADMYQELIDELHALDEMERLASATLTPTDGGIRQLVDYDLAADGHALAAVSDRNLDTAAEVTVVVPGMFSDADTLPQLFEVGGYVRQNSTIQGLASEGHAVLAWTNYDSPEAADVNAVGPAERGGARLGENLAGLQAARGQAVDVNVIAHSYGTTTAHVALSSAADAYGVDQVFYLASAGVTAYGSATPYFDDEAAAVRYEYAYGAAGLHASTTSGDSVARWGQLGEHAIDPTDPRAASGVTVFDTDPGAHADGSVGSDIHELTPSQAQAAQGERGYVDGNDSAAARYIGQVIATS